MFKHKERIPYVFLKNISEKIKNNFFVMILDLKQLLLHIMVDLRPEHTASCFRGPCNVMQGEFRWVGPTSQWFQSPHPSKITKKPHINSF